MRYCPCRLAAWTIGLSLMASQAVLAQNVPPLPDPAPNVRPQADLNNLIHQMAERVRRLGEDIASDLGRTPQGRHLIQDLRELAISIDEFHESLHNTRYSYQQRQAYTGIDQSWHHLKWQLTQPGVASPAVGRAAGRVDELDAAIHQALGLRMYTPAYAPLPAGAPAVPTEFVEAQRLAVALEQRAQALAATVQAEMAGVPGADRLARDAARLAQACDAFNDSIREGQTVDVIRTAFGSVAAVADRFETDLQAYKLPAPVDASWRSFAAAEVLLRQRLGLATPPPAVDMVLQPAGNGPSPVLALADRLNAQLDAFLAAFTPTVRVVPEGEWILADAQRLKAAAVAFREECGRGVDSYRLSQQFIAVDQLWSRLARRINRIARGRTGPNIQTAMQMGETCRQIHQLLGMPGYPPTLGAVVPADGQ